MAKKDLVDYIRQNKDKYGIEMLRSELLKTGYTDAEIREAEAELQSPPAPQVASAAPAPSRAAQATPGTAVPSAAAAPAGGQGLAGKQLNWYWNIAKMPVLIVVGWAGIVWLLGLIPIIGGTFILMDLFVGWLLSIGAAIFVGYNGVKKFNATLVQALIAGAVGGILAGAGKAVFDVIGMLTSGSLAGTLGGLFGLIWIPLGEATLWLVVAVVVAALLGAGKGQKTS